MRPPPTRSRPDAAPGAGDRALGLVPDPRGTIITVRVIPRAGRTAIDGVRGDALLIRLAAAPVGGAANDALLDLLSHTLRVPRRRLTILSGASTRDKRILIHDTTIADVTRFLQRQPRPK
jgi:uncharacterized protein YggU (UPF0235/DUF167 family)